MWRAVDMVLLFLADILSRFANLCTEFSAITRKVISPTIHHAGKWPGHICSVLQVFSRISWSSPPSVLSHWCDANCLARHFTAKNHKLSLCPLSSFGFDSFDKSQFITENRNRRVNLKTSCSCLRMATIFSADAAWKANQKWSVPLILSGWLIFEKAGFRVKINVVQSQLPWQLKQAHFPAFYFIAYLTLW